jgi:hypothetical protein
LLLDAAYGALYPASLDSGQETPSRIGECLPDGSGARDWRRSVCSKPRWRRRLDDCDRLVGESAPCLRRPRGDCLKPSRHRRGRAADDGPVESLKSADVRVEVRSQRTRTTKRRAQNRTHTARHEPVGDADVLELFGTGPRHLGDVARNGTAETRAEACRGPDGQTLHEGAGAQAPSDSRRRSTSRASTRCRRYSDRGARARVDRGATPVLCVADLALEVQVDQLVLTRQRADTDRVECVVGEVLPEGTPEALRFVDSPRLSDDMTRWIDVERRSVGCIQVPMQTRRLIDLAEVAVLGQEPAQFGIEVAGLGVVEAGLGVVDVSGEGEAVGRGRQLGWEAEVAPGILGN